MTQYGITTLIEASEYPNSFTTLYNGTEYPLQRDITDITDLVQRAHHELYTLDKFKNTPSYTSHPFYISGDGIMFDQNTFDIKETDTYFNRDALPVYANGGRFGLGAIHKRIHALDNPETLQYYTSRLNSFGWKRKPDSIDKKIETDNLNFVEKIIA